MLTSLNILYVKNKEFAHKKMIEALEFMSMDVKTVTDGERAYKEYEKNKPDIIITDIEVPALNGLELLERIRQKDNSTQMIVVTKSTEISHLLKAIELKIVKYLVEYETSFNDLKNAIILCRENISKKKSKLLKFFNKKDHYDLNRRILYVNGKIIRLDCHERDFLELLLRNDLRIVQYSEIENVVWKDNMTSAAIRSLVRNLRKKLPIGVIENISKKGYRVITQNS